MKNICNGGFVSFISTENFKKMVKKERINAFPTPFELVYSTFCEHKFDHRDEDFFLKNTSEYVETMRKYCWQGFENIEKKFTSKMLSSLISRERIDKMTPYGAISDFISTYPEHIYNLTLSNTQSRRTRAGNEFEAIIELMMIGANVYADTQGAIGKSYFQTNQLGKLVDLVIPGVVFYLSNKRNTMLVSAKTTLRERWQEVPEEISRTGIREIYLATVDDSISNETINILYEANVIIVVTKAIKQARFNSNNKVIVFEEMLQHAKELSKKLHYEDLSSSELDLLRKSIIKQMHKYDSYPYVKKHYEKRLAAIPSH
ncbi:restriction endonuclease [Escherichia coli]|nr:restriction endonuclease [Escherichia coli]EEW5075196.1 restriction endonuclease [Escherichia coli]EEY2486809.1 restriction endonuclease [Escherichia coli]EFF3875649.1 restriction endonuclease [Escherichia coli]EFF3886339.1 restriction endonuclease [Escherichia coli]